MTVSTETVRIAKSRPGKNQSERSDLPCHIIIKHIDPWLLLCGPVTSVTQCGPPDWLVRGQYFFRQVKHNDEYTFYEDGLRAKFETV